MEGASLISDLESRCRRAREESTAPCTVVAIDGHSAAGKSSVASHLVRVLEVALIRGDDFYSVMDGEERAGLPPDAGVNLYYDWRRMRDEAIVPLRAGRPAVYHPYDWDLNRLSADRIVIDPAALVVVEGLFVARPELVDFVDIAVVVEADAETRAKRQAQRGDATGEWLERWDRAERHYLTSVRPPRSFDVRLSGVEEITAD